MTYAIMQKELVVPEVERLRRAFSVSPALTDLDAQNVANDAYGILWRGLDVENASALQDALQRENISTEVVEEHRLPALNAARVVRQIEFDAAHVTLFDSMKRPTRVAWPDLMFIAAGLIKQIDPRRVRSGRDENSYKTVAAKETIPGDLILEFFLNDGATRFCIDGEDFSYDHLGGRASEDLAMNFVLLVQDVARHSPQAGQNRGACRACTTPPELFPYPHKKAFQEELVWMLWRIGQLRTGRS